MIVWENHDDFDGATQTRYGPLEPPPPPAGEPFLHANVYGDEFIHGNNFDFDELRVIEITNDTACTGRVYTSDWEWQFDGAQFCDDGDLKPDHHVIISTVDPDGEPAVLIRELVIHDVVITGADPGNDSVSGLATPESTVLVGIVDNPGDPFSFQDEREVTADTNGIWTADFGIEIDGQEVKAFQFDDDGDLTTSEWWEAEPQLFVNLLDDYALLQGWPSGASIDLEVFEGEGDPEPIANVTLVPGPYYRFDKQTDIEGIDLLSGYHVVATNGEVEVSHTVTELAITGFDFPANSFTGTKFTDTSVAAGAWNDSSEGEVGPLFDSPWTADFSGQVNFRLYDHIGGYVAEFDDAQNATFFYFEATYEELDNADGTATTDDGRITIENLGTAGPDSDREGHLRVRLQVQEGRDGAYGQHRVHLPRGGSRVPLDVL